METGALSNNRKFFIIGIYATAMGFLEAIVVVYLRLQFYPEGFDFPFKMLPPDLILIEWVREIATVVMLATVGMIAGNERLQRFFFFLFTFAVWDIVYYIGLKIFLDWPESLLTWDILFLIPIPWIGPVLAPVICSFTMIVFSVSAIKKQENGFPLEMKLVDWILMFTGVFLILYSFTEDFFRLIYNNNLFSKFSTLSTNEDFWKIISEFVPITYNWTVFITGELLILLANFLVIRRMKVAKNR
jgi:hypothetical protein